MKSRLLVVVAATLLSALCARADWFSTKEPFSKSGPFSPTGTVSLENVNGNIEVRAWDRNEIKIEGEKSAKTEEELRLIELTIEQDPERAAIKVKLPKRKSGWFGSGQVRGSVNFTLTVPAGTRLDGVGTVNGSVSIRGVHGEIRASSVNGRVKVTDAAGSLRISTVNGGLDAELASLPSGSTVDAHCVNGGIALALPENVAATLNASVVNGGIHCDFPVEISGRFIGRSLHGKVGGGGSEVRAKTVNGGVTIRRTQSPES